MKGSLLNLPTPRDYSVEIINARERARKAKIK